MSSLSLTHLSKYIDLHDSNFQYTALVAFLCPTIWNILARVCNNITAGKSKSFQYTTCYALALWIFCFSSFRDYLFSQTLKAQPVLPIMYEHGELLRIIGPIIIITGQVFVLSSLFQLGITGTFLGDYCGILMKERVTAFPFNVLNDPMYVGATISFLGYSIYSASLAGLVLTVWIGVLYAVALQFEGPYTTWIYEEAARKKSKAQ